MRSCVHCGTTTEELRPYGPGGSWVCFRCAMKPENRATTEASFNALLDAAETVGDGVVTIGTEEGPVPGYPDAS